MTETYSTTTLNCMPICKVSGPMGDRQKKDFHTLLLIIKRCMQLMDNRHAKSTGRPAVLGHSASSL